MDEEKVDKSYQLPGEIKQCENSNVYSVQILCLRQVKYQEL